MVEKIKAPFKGFDSPRTDGHGVWSDDKAQKITVPVQRLDRGFLGMKEQAEFLLQKITDSQLPLVELGGVLVQQDKIVHITKVKSDLELVFDKAVQLVKVKIGKKLGGQRADGHTAMHRRMKQAFVARYIPQEVGVSTKLGTFGWVLGRLVGSTAVHSDTSRSSQSSP